MPLGFHPHPGGILDNSPTFQRWVPQSQAIEVPKGRLRPCDKSTVPFVVWLARLSDRAKACWLWDFTTAAERYKDSPQWATVGKAMSDDSDRLWPYADVDTHAFSLWPLVTRYNWTYRDLLNVLRSLNPQPAAKNHFHRYPCDREQDLASYCANVLGLRKTSKGIGAKNARPAGYEIAQQLWLGPGGNRTDKQDK